MAGMPPAAPPVSPLPAAVAVLWRMGERGLEVCWLLRAKALRFAGGFHAFPGGKVDPCDARVPVEGAQDTAATLRAAAARELYEEVGILAARGGSIPEATERRAMLDGAVGFGELLARHGLTLHAEDFVEAGRWVTPTWMPHRFDTHFFLVRAPESQVLDPWVGELSEGGYIPVADALARWEEGRLLLHPPQLHVLRTLAGFGVSDAALERLRRGPGTPDGVPGETSFQRGIHVVPLRTATLPPATHTNCYVLGEGELLIVDPGTDDEEELGRLDAQLARLAAEGARPTSIVLTHHHGDHAGGAVALAARTGLPIACHPWTAARLGLTHSRALNDGEVIALAGPRPMRWRVLHTPGHAPGHLCLVDASTGAAIVGDMVAGVGTILIDPPEGDMAQYLSQLKRLRDLPCATLHPAHGAPLPDAEHALNAYLAHRSAREAMVLGALREVADPLEEVAARAYPDTPVAIMFLAERSALAHLLKLESEGSAARDGERWRRA